MKAVFVVVILSSLLLEIGQSIGTRPEIVDDILPEVKQQGQIGYLNCSVINLSESAVVSWIKETTPTNTPLQISTNEDILQNYQVEGHNKYDVIRTVNNNREQYQLVIRALTENDAGNYNCQIRLTNLNYKQWPRKTASLTVQIAPTIKTRSDSNIIVKEGSNVTLKCEANGIPTPNITWKRTDGLPMPGGGFQYWGSQYDVYNIAATDRGQFLCIADNNVRPPADFAVQVEVMFAPYCTAQQNTVGQVQNRRFPAKLDCIVASNPRAQVTWYKFNPVSGRLEAISDNDKYDLNQQDDQRLKNDEKWYSLTIKQVQGNDFGKFYCHAKNNYGENNATFILFETMECQGPLCPSIGGNTGAVIRSSVYTLTVAAVLVMSIYLKN